MKIHKKLFIVLPLFALLIGTTACSEDEDSCEAPAISENIIGSWEVSTSGDIVEFNADGTLSDPDDALLSAGGLPNKTYVASAVEIEITAADDSGVNTFSTTFTVEDNQCDKITISFLGSRADLIRQ